MVDSLTDIYLYCAHRIHNGEIVFGERAVSNSQWIAASASSGTLRIGEEPVLKEGFAGALQIRDLKKFAKLVKEVARQGEEQFVKVVHFYSEPANANTLKRSEQKNATAQTGGTEAPQSQIQRETLDRATAIAFITLFVEKNVEEIEEQETQCVARLAHLLQLLQSKHDTLEELFVMSENWCGAAPTGALQIFSQVVQIYAEGIRYQNQVPPMLHYQPSSPAIYQQQRKQNANYGGSNKTLIENNQSQHLPDQNPRARAENLALLLNIDVERLLDYTALLLVDDPLRVFDACRTFKMLPATGNAQAAIKVLVEGRRELHTKKEAFLQTVRRLLGVNVPQSLLSSFLLHKGMPLNEVDVLRELRKLYAYQQLSVPRELVETVLHLTAGHTEFILHKNLSSNQQQVLPDEWQVSTEGKLEKQLHILTQFLLQRNTLKSQEELIAHLLQQSPPKQRVYGIFFALTLFFELRSVASFVLTSFKATPNSAAKRISTLAQLLQETLQVRGTVLRVVPALAKFLQQSRGTEKPESSNSTLSHALSTIVQFVALSSNRKGQEIIMNNIAPHLTHYHRLMQLLSLYSRVQGNLGELSFDLNVSFDFLQLLNHIQEVKSLQKTVQQERQNVNIAKFLQSLQIEQNNFWLLKDIVLGCPIDAHAIAQQGFDLPALFNRNLIAQVIALYTCEANLLPQQIKEYIEEIFNSNILLKQILDKCTDDDDDQAEHQLQEDTYAMNEKVDGRILLARSLSVLHTFDCKEPEAPSIVQLQGMQKNFSEEQKTPETFINTSSQRKEDEWLHLAFALGQGHCSVLNAYAHLFPSLLSKRTAVQSSQNETSVSSAIEAVVTTLSCYSEEIMRTTQQVAHFVEEVRARAQNYPKNFQTEQLLASTFVQKYTQIACSPLKIDPFCFLLCAGNVHAWEALIQHHYCFSACEDTCTDPKVVLFLILNFFLLPLEIKEALVDQEIALCLSAGLQQNERQREKEENFDKFVQDWSYSENIVFYKQFTQMIRNRQDCESAARFVHFPLEILDLVLRAHEHYGSPHQQNQEDDQNEFEYLLRRIRSKNRSKSVNPNVFQEPTAKQRDIEDCKSIYSLIFQALCNLKVMQYDCSEEKPAERRNYSSTFYNTEVKNENESLLSSISESFVFSISLLSELCILRKAFFTAQNTGSADDFEGQLLARSLTVNSLVLKCVAAAIPVQSAELAMREFNTLIGLCIGFNFHTAKLLPQLNACIDVNLPQLQTLRRIDQDLHNRQSLPEISLNGTNLLQKKQKITQHLVLSFLKQYEITHRITLNAIAESFNKQYVGKATRFLQNRFFFSKQSYYKSRVQEVALNAPQLQRQKTFKEDLVQKENLSNIFQRLDYDFTRQSDVEGFSVSSKQTNNAQSNSVFRPTCHDAKLLPVMCLARGRLQFIEKNNQLKMEFKEELTFLKSLSYLLSLRGRRMAASELYHNLQSITQYTASDAISLAQVIFLYARAEGKINLYRVQSASRTTNQLAFDAIVDLFVHESDAARATAIKSIAYRCKDTNSSMLAKQVGVGIQLLQGKLDAIVSYLHTDFNEQRSEREKDEEVLAFIENNRQQFTRQSVWQLLRAAMQPISFQQNQEKKLSPKILRYLYLLAVRAYMRSHFYVISGDNEQQQEEEEDDDDDGKEQEEEEDDNISDNQLISLQQFLHRESLSTLLLQNLETNGLHQLRQFSIHSVKIIPMSKNIQAYQPPPPHEQGEKLQKSEVGGSTQLSYVLRRLFLIRKSNMLEDLPIADYLDFLLFFAPKEVHGRHSYEQQDKESEKRHCETLFNVYSQIFERNATNYGKVRANVQDFTQIYDLIRAIQKDDKNALIKHFVQIQDVTGKSQLHTESVLITLNLSQNIAQALQQQGIQEKFKTNSVDWLQKNARRSTTANGFTQEQQLNARDKNDSSFKEIWKKKIARCVVQHLDVQLCATGLLQHFDERFRSAQFHSGSSFLFENAEQQQLSLPNFYEHLQLSEEFNSLALCVQDGTDSLYYALLTQILSGNIWTIVFEQSKIVQRFAQIAAAIELLTNRAIDSRSGSQVLLQLQEQLLSAVLERLAFLRSERNSANRKESEYQNKKYAEDGQSSQFLQNLVTALLADATMHKMTQIFNNKSQETYLLQFTVLLLIFELGLSIEDLQPVLRSKIISDRQSLVCEAAKQLQEKLKNLRVAGAEVNNKLPLKMRSGETLLQEMNKLFILNSGILSTTDAEIVWQAIDQELQIHEKLSPVSTSSQDFDKIVLAINQVWLCANKSITNEQYLMHVQEFVYNTIALFFKAHDAQSEEKVQQLLKNCICFCVGDSMALIDVLQTIAPSVDGYRELKHLVHELQNSRELKTAESLEQLKRAEEKRRLQAKDPVLQLVIQKALSNLMEEKISFQELFQVLDKCVCEGNGHIKEERFEQLLLRLGIAMTKHRVRQVYVTCIKNPELAILQLTENEFEDAMTQVIKQKTACVLRLIKISGRQLQIKLLWIVLLMSILFTVYLVSLSALGTPSILAAAIYSLVPILCGALILYFTSQKKYLKSELLKQKSLEALKNDIF